jgi:hypothetical protein
MKTPIDRFLEKVAEPYDAHNDCWEWTAALFDSGYGQFTAAGRNRRAHRFAYEAFVGPIPEGLTLDHICGNRRCVNPDHLEPVTIKENTSRSPLTMASINRTKTHCLRGHEFTPENTLIVPGGRSCKICQRAREHARYRKEGN